MQGKYNVYFFFLYNPVLLGTSDIVLFIFNTSREYKYFYFRHFNNYTIVFIRRYQVSMPRTVIYCRRYEDTSSLYEYFRAGLKLEGGFVERSDAQTSLDSDL